VVQLWKASLNLVCIVARSQSVVLNAVLPQLQEVDSVQIADISLDLISKPLLPLV
jgi:hypothetical protein